MTINSVIAIISTFNASTLWSLVLGVLIVAVSLGGILGTMRDNKLYVLIVRRSIHPSIDPM